MYSSEKNLYELYRLIGAGRFATSMEYRNHCIVSGSEGSWPQLIFDIQDSPTGDISLESVFLNTAEFPEVRFAVCNRELIKQTEQELLRRQQVFPVGTWQLLEMKNGEDLRVAKQEGVEIRKLIQPAAIDDFSSLVNNNLMKGSFVKTEMFQELAQQSCIGMYGLFIKNELVSGLLSYTGANDVTGLYFITTKTEFRGKGLAAIIMGNIMNLLFQQGTRKVVLQAFSKAVSLYTRVGFSNKGELIIFWKK